MAGKSKIEWTEQTWNPIVGCSIVSPGCTNCYAMRLAGTRLDREDGPAHYRGTTQASKAGPVWTGKLARAPDHILTAPLRRKKPTTYFVNSMGDLFHDDVPDEWIDRVFAVMALCPQHTFQVLTKRSERMRGYLSPTIQRTNRWIQADNFRLSANPDVQWQAPLKNVWLGVSAERQQEADERIPLLLQTPAAIRFVSLEPLLGPIDLENLKFDGGEKIVHGFCGQHAFRDGDHWEHAGEWPGIDWVIVGGESGPNARPMHPRWARDLRDQCAVGVPFFFKQWGEHAWGELIDDDREEPYRRWTNDDADSWRLDEYGKARCDLPQWWPSKVGKKAAGRLLDGIEHNGMPANPEA